MNEQVAFETADGVTIVGDYYEGGSDKAVLLLHMMPATRASWVALANALTAAGFSALAIDLRGHGESTKGPGETVLNYQEFQDADHQKSMADVEAAIQFLRQEKKMREISIAGASIGANLAFVYASEHHEIRSIILLSPGLTYRGVDTGAVAEHFQPPQRVLCAASEDDEYSAASAKELHEKLAAEKRIEMFSDAGHGTTMIERKPEFMALLIEWLQAV